MENYHSDENLTLAIKDQILIITLNRPKANAIDNATSRRMGTIFEKFRDDPDLKVAVLTGAGDKFFCAGWDLKAAAKGETVPDDDYGVGGFGGLQQLKNLNKPVIGAINGIAFGGGFEIMIACDIIFASPNAKFALPEIHVGVLADAATIKLRRRIPYHIAVELLMTGRHMSTEEAKHWGLINHIIPHENLLEAAMECAKTLAEGPPLLFHAIKDILRQSEMTMEQAAFDQILGLHSVQKLYHSEDVKEGPKAFAEKRTPNWQGK